MAQEITQTRVQFLETVGEDKVLEMVAEGQYLDDIARFLDPDARVGISKSVLSRWLSGKLKRNVAPAETEEEAKARGAKYTEAKKHWAEAIVEGQAKKLFDEENPMMANLRKAQSDFALRIAAIWDKRFQPPSSGANVAVQVNVNNGEHHLNALRRRQVVVVKPTPVETLLDDPSVSPFTVIEPGSAEDKATGHEYKEEN